MKSFQFNTLLYLILATNFAVANGTGQFGVEATSPSDNGSSRQFCVKMDFNAYEHRFLAVIPNAQDLSITEKLLLEYTEYEYWRWTGIDSKQYFWVQTGEKLLSRMIDFTNMSYEKRTPLRMFSTNVTDNLSGLNCSAPGICLPINNQNDCAFTDGVSEIWLRNDSSKFLIVKNKRDNTEVALGKNAKEFYKILPVKADDLVTISVTNAEPIINFKIGREPVQVQPDSGLIPPDGGLVCRDDAAAATGITCDIKLFWEDGPYLGSPYAAAPDTLSRPNLFGTV